MRVLRSRGRRFAAGVVVLAVAAAVAALAASAHTTAVSHGAMTPSVMNAPSHVIPATLVDNPTGLVRFTCQLPNFTGGFKCYGPDQMRAAYSVTPLLAQGNDGTGKTIVIVDAFGSATVAADLARFDSVWGLPTANLQVDNPYGASPTSTGWAEETSLDVQWAHAIAPGAKIELVLAKTNNDSDILDATQWAVDNNVGDVISQSFGEGEACMAPADLARQHQIFEAATAKGITLFASSGDQGSGQPGCTPSDPEYFKSASTPASDPNVTSVGGTDLNADGVSGAYSSETTWNESLDFGDAVAGGGGVSTLFARPDYQAPFVKDTHAREVPDVSYNAAVLDGVVVAFRGGFLLIGGTSSGSPQWAALTAITDQLAGGRVGAINKTLYHLGKLPNASSYFHDVADGSTNAIPDLSPFQGAGTGTPISGFDAVSGYDMATGLGSPIASALLPAIAKAGNG